MFPSGRVRFELREEEQQQQQQEQQEGSMSHCTNNRLQNKIGGVLLFRLCLEKGVWLLLSCLFIGSSSSQN